MTDDEFLRAFEQCTVAREEWTHEAHVRMAWLYLTRTDPGADPLDCVRRGIKKLNLAFIRRQQMLRCISLTKAKDPRGLDGYHETITVAFVTVIAARIRPGEDFSAFRDRNPDLFERSFPALLKHYSPGQLYCSTAKKEFVEPDLEPLPKL